MYDVLSIRRSNPIDAVLTEAGVELQSRGRRLVGCCPLHGDGQPSLVVYPDSQSYFCFGCGAGGDVIDFVSRLRDVGFKEAASILAGSERQPAVQPPSLPSATPPISSVKLTRREADVIDAATSTRTRSSIASSCRGRTLPSSSSLSGEEKIVRITFDKPAASGIGAPAREDR